MSTRMHPPTGSRAREGSAILASLALAFLLASVSFVLTDVMVSDYRQQGRRHDEVTLLATAESAANEAYAYFQASPSTTLPKITDLDAAGNSIGLLPVKYDESSAMFSTAIPHNNLQVYSTIQLLEDPDPSSWGDETYMLKATAIAGTWDAAGNVTSDANFYRRRRVEMLIKPQPIRFFNQAMFAINGYDFMGSAMTDSFDSRLANYAVPEGEDHNGDEGDIGSRGAIDVAASTDLNGKANSGQTNFLPDVDFVIPPSAISINSPGSTGIKASYTITKPGSYRTSFISLGANQILRLEGGGQIELWVDSYIAISKGLIQYDNKTTTLIIHQNDYTSGETTEFGIGNTGIGTIAPVAGGVDTGQSAPQQLQIYSKYDGTMNLNGTAEFSGVIFAPYSTFSLNGTFDFMGSLVCNAFADVDAGKVNGNFKFHYDIALRSLAPNVEPRLAVAGWRSYTLRFGTSDE
jgi:hypothetical protein